MSQYLTDVAISVPFDNSTNGFTSTNVQTAIEESLTTTPQLEAAASGAVAAGTGADTLMTGMTLSPPAGTYIALFSCDITSTTPGAAITASLYVNGVLDTLSQRKIIPCDGGTLSSGSGRDCISINKRVVVGAGQSVEIRWSASSGTNNVASRTLNLIRVL